MKRTIAVLVLAFSACGGESPCQAFTESKVFNGRWVWDRTDPALSWLPDNPGYDVMQLGTENFSFTAHACKVTSLSETNGAGTCRALVLCEDTNGTTQSGVVTVWVHESSLESDRTPGQVATYTAATWSIELELQGASFRGKTSAP